jgi:hypothetical protein
VATGCTDLNNPNDQTADWFIGRSKKRKNDRLCRGKKKKGKKRGKKGGKKKKEKAEPVDPTLPPHGLA